VDYLILDGIAGIDFPNQNYGSISEI